MIRAINSVAAMRLVMQYHYSQRKVGCCFAFGLFDSSDLIGCCTFSIPASYTLCKGVCGSEYRNQVVELSRLVIIPGARKNAASMLIGGSLRLMPDRVVVSYADCNDHVGHVGYVYQATNWIYTGKSNAEPKWINPITGDVVSYTRRHIDAKAERVGLSWRELVREKQSGKHRYVTFTGSKQFKKTAKGALRYQAQPYPKGETHRIVIEKTSVQPMLEM